MIKKLSSIFKTKDKIESIEQCIDLTATQGAAINLAQFNYDEILKYKKQIKEQEEEIIKLREQLISDEKTLKIQSKKITSNEEELTGYINRIFEQQERERIVKWIVNSIRESLDINEVLSTTVDEIGKVLRVDRCLISLYDSDKSKFILKSEYKLNDEIDSSIPIGSEFSIPRDWHKLIANKRESIVVDDINSLSQTRKKTQHSDTKSFILTPVIHKGEVLGIIAVYQVDYIREWKESNIDILRYIGSQIAVAIIQARLHTDIKKQSDRETLLRNTITTVRSSLDINEVIQNIVTEIGIAFKADKCYVRLYDEKEDDFLVSKGYFETNNKSCHIKPNYHCRYWGEELKAGQSILITEVDDYIAENNLQNSEIAEHLKTIQVKGLLAIPIIFSENTLGVFILHYIDNNRKFHEDEIELLHTIASQTGIALHQLSLYKTLQETAKRESLLRNIITTIRSTLEQDKILSIICAEVAKIFDIDKVCVFTPKSPIDYSSWELKKEHLADESLKSSQGCLITGEVATCWGEEICDKGSRIVIDNTSEANIPTEVKKFYQELDVKSIVGFPVKKGDDVWGVLFLSTCNNYKSWTTEDIDILESITDQVYIAVRQADLYEKSEETNRLKSEFLSSMSHEFRTPLNAIIGFSDMLLGGNYGSLSAKQFEYLKNITYSGKHLLRLVTDVLDLSKVESGNMQLIYEQMDQKQLIMESVATLKSVAIKKNIEISLELTDILINADSKRFTQIMYNLLSNAIKFTEVDGEILVKSIVQGNKLRIEVIDTGIGISEQYSEHVFDQFAQVDSSYARKQEGTGLGLTLTKKLVELHGGTIGVESKVGIGSKFWFVIPGVVS